VRRVARRRASIENLLARAEGEGFALLAGTAARLANPAQVVIVTISREYGAAGLAIADGVAHALGYELLTDDLPKSVAARLGTSAESVSQIASAEQSLPERLLAGLGEGTAEVITPRAPRLPDEFDEAVRREIERTIRERAERGDIVILGRNAGVLLGSRPDLLRVFLTAEREWRVERLRAAFGHDRAAALADIERVDAARRKFAKDRYKYSWGDARSYDLTLEVSRFGIEAAVALIVAAVRAAGTPLER
jgi:cytidylate kinase